MIYPMYYLNMIKLTFIYFNELVILIGSVRQEVFVQILSSEPKKKTTKKHKTHSAVKMKYFQQCKTHSQKVSVLAFLTTFHVQNGIILRTAGYLPSLKGQICCLYRTADCCGLLSYLFLMSCRHKDGQNQYTVVAGDCFINIQKEQEVENIYIFSRVW